MSDRKVMYEYYAEWGNSQLTIWLNGVISIYTTNQGTTTMAANLARTESNTAMFASLRELPWHGQGVVLPDAVTGQEMLKAASLDWSVSSAPVMVPIPNKKAIYRDGNKMLGIVGNDYHMFQNSQMVDFFEGLVTGRKISYECAGALGNGEAVWILAKIPDLTMAIKGDEMNGYMLIRNGHIGNLNLACFPTSVRVVCQNTMMAAHSEFAARRRKHGKNTVHAGYRIRHTSSMTAAVRDVQSAYANLLKDFESTKSLYELLAGRQVTTAEVKAYFEKMAGVKSEADALSKAAATRQERKLEVLNELWESPTNQLSGTRNTALSLYNTLVEWVDHAKGTRCVDKTEEASRFESAMFGQGADIKESSLIEALALV